MTPICPCLKRCLVKRDLGFCGLCPTKSRSHSCASHPIQTVRHFVDRKRPAQSCEESVGGGRSNKRPVTIVDCLSAGDPQSVGDPQTALYKSVIGLRLWYRLGFRTSLSVPIGVTLVASSKDLRPDIGTNRRSTKWRCRFPAITRRASLDRRGGILRRCGSI